LGNCIQVYTDGASSGNPGPGAYAAILQAKNGYKELVRGFRKTTNNRMELWAVIAALEALKVPNQVVKIYSDSRYVVDAVEKRWLHKWIQNGFQQKKNPDLWQRFWTLYNQHQVTLAWVKGHANNPANERCDQLATQRTQKGPWDIDIVYENEVMAPSK
jgi:ribonuclease HI